MPAIRVLIVDDHEIVREGLQTLLLEESDIEIAGEARNGAEAVRGAAATRPDVVLMDLSMPGIEGIEAIRLLRAASPESHVLVLTSFVDDRRVLDAIQAGATGYLMKDVLKSDLLDAIRAAACGQPTLHPLAQQALMRQTVSADTQPHANLTQRERDVLRLIADGNSNKQIASLLFLSEGTIKGYVSAVLAKLGVSDRTQAALYAVKHGLNIPGGGEGMKE